MSVCKVVGDMIKTKNGCHNWFNIHSLKICLWNAQTNPMRFVIEIGNFELCMDYGVLWTFLCMNFMENHDSSFSFFTVHTM